MASMWRRTMVYLGLVDDPDDGEDAPATARSGDAGPNVRPLSREESPGRVRAVPNSAGGARTMPSASAARVHVTEPRTFNDAQEVGDRLKANQPVILNLRGVEKDLQRRLIDFASGLAYALSGSMSRVDDQVFLLTPSNVEVSAEEKERLVARGLFRA